MSRILITYESYDPCNQTDTDLFIGILSACNAKHRVLHKPEATVTKSDLEKTDLLLMIRPTSLCALELAKAAKRAGIFVVSSFDDDLINIQKGPHYEHFHWRRGYAKRVLALTDLLLCENPLIEQDYRPFLKHSRSLYLHLCVNDMEKKRSPVKKGDEVLHVLYAAGPDHSHFFNEVVGPSIAPLLSRYPGRFDFTFLGVTPDLSFFPEGTSVRLVSMIPFAEFTVFLKAGNFDLGLAPLKDTHFYNRKGVSKYIDYSLVGVLGLYSNCMPYTMAVRHMENGLLIENTAEDWLDAFSFCAEHPKEVKRMAKNAQDDLEKNYSVDAVAESLKKEIPEFFTLPERSASKVRLCKNPFARARFSLRRFWNEKALPPMIEKKKNLSEQIHARGFFGAIGHYLKKPFCRNGREKETL